MLRNCNMPRLKKPRFKKKFLGFFRFMGTMTEHKGSWKTKAQKNTWKSTWKTSHTWYALLLFMDYSIQKYKHYFINLHNKNSKDLNWAFEVSRFLKNSLLKPNFTAVQYAQSLNLEWTCSLLGSWCPPILCEFYVFIYCLMSGSRDKGLTVGG